MKDSEEIRILVADEHAMCREALRNLLEREPEFRVAGEADDGEETLRQIILLKPHILLLDLVIPRSAIHVLRSLQDSDSDPKTPVLILAESMEAPQIIETLKLGASGFVLKESSPEVLFKSIRAVCSGEYWIGRRVVGDLIEALRNGNQAAGGDLRPAPFSLTRRELEIIAEVAEGCTNKNIAEKLSIAEQTVKHHLTSIFQKVGVTNRLELAVFAMHRGIRGNS
jgi:DNA-binding NarL/FixJ family response regulator